MPVLRKRPLKGKLSDDNGDSWSSDDDSSSDDEADSDSSDTEGSSSDSESPDSDDDEWTKNVNQFHCPAFVQTTGPDIPDDTVTELDYFKLFLTDEVIDLMVSNTNLYALLSEEHTDMKTKWEATTYEEMHALIGSEILMGIHQLPQVRDYWSEAWGLGVPEVASVMPLSRFESLHHFLHVNDNSTALPGETPGSDKMHKVRPFLNLIQANFMKYFVPHQAVSIDESMTAFKGRSSMKQYQPMKPIKRGFKSWAMACPRTGYTFAMEPYTGKVGDKETGGLGERVIKGLASLLPPTPGYIVHCDRFFTTVKLAQDLLEQEVYMVGTLMENRGVPPSLRKINLPKSMKRGDMSAYQSTSAGSERLTILVWKDRKPIHFISTAYPPSVSTTCQRKQKDGTKATIPCPAVVIGYNKGMGGVDLADQYAEYYPLGHATNKWWPRLLWRYMGVALVNSFLLYKLTSPMYDPKKDAGHKHFNLAVARQMIGDFCSRKRIGRPLVSGLASPRSEHQQVKLEGRIQQCQHCMSVAKRKKQHPQDDDSPVKRPRETYFGCLKCGVHLCRGACYRKWHKP